MVMDSTFLPLPFAYGLKSWSLPVANLYDVTRNAGGMGCVTGEMVTRNTIKGTDPQIEEESK